MKKVLLSALMFVLALTGSAQIERPKLVVGLVVDQMRWDYLYYYYDQFVDGGLKRLVDEGFNCENNMINYVPTVTGIGHASIYTGSTPALHSIAGNDFYLDGKFTYCCSDSEINGVGSDGHDVCHNNTLILPQRNRILLFLLSDRLYLYRHNLWYGHSLRLLGNNN